MIRGLLTEEQRALFEPFVIGSGALRCRAPHNHRRTLDVVFWIALTGALWHNRPEELERWNSVYRQFRRWTTSGLLDLVLEALAEGGSNACVQIVDSTVVLAHHCAAGTRRGAQNRALSSSGGAFTTKIHTRTNAEGLPEALLLTSSEAHGSTMFSDLMTRYGADPDEMLGHEWYDSDAIRDEVYARGSEPEISTKRNRTVQHTLNRALYATRTRIERFFNRLENSRRVTPPSTTVRHVAFWGLEWCLQ